MVVVMMGLAENWRGVKRLLLSKMKKGKELKVELVVEGEGVDREEDELRKVGEVKERRERGSGRVE